MSKYIDVDAFVENFRMTQLLLKVWAGPNLTPEQEIVIQSGEARPPVGRNRGQKLKYPKGQRWRQRYDTVRKYAEEAKRKNE
jgi:hypothetical protein